MNCGLHNIQRRILAPLLDFGTHRHHTRNMPLTKKRNGKNTKKNTSTTVTYTSKLQTVGVGPMLSLNLCFLRKLLLKNIKITMTANDISFIAIVFQNVRQTYLLYVNLIQIPTNHKHVSTIYHVRIHVN